jgi:hypothetical protein
MWKTHAEKACVNGPLSSFVDRWQEKSLFLKLLVVDILTSACFAIGKFIFLCGEKKAINKKESQYFVWTRLGKQTKK